MLKPGMMNESVETINYNYNPFENTDKKQMITKNVETPNKSS